MCRWLVCGLVVVLVTSGIALGQDFVDDQIFLLEPGLTMEIIQDLGENPCSITAGGDVDGTGWSSFLCIPIPAVVSPVKGGFFGGGVDALGNLYHIKMRNTVPGEGNAPECFLTSKPIHEIERRTPFGAVPIAQIPFQRTITADGSCPGEYICPPNEEMWQRTQVVNLSVDAVNGHLYLAIKSFRNCEFSPTNEPINSSIIRISGLPTLLDIVPTFTPGSGSLSWITPKHPEALPAADTFQIFTGDIRDVSDFRLAVAQDCSIPDMGSPQPGQLFSIPDPIPTPDLGQGSFLLLGVENAGQRRFGRQNIGGVLSGRDPGAFTGCN